MDGRSQSATDRQRKDAEENNERGDRRRIGGEKETRILDYNKSETPIGPWGRSTLLSSLGGSSTPRTTESAKRAG